MERKGSVNVKGYNGTIDAIKNLYFLEHTTKIFLVRESKSLNISQLKTIN